MVSVMGVEGGREKRDKQADLKEFRSRELAKSKIHRARFRVEIE